MLTIFFAVLISTVQFSDTYLKYLPFRDGAPDAERALLWRRLLSWGILSAVVYCAMLRHFGISAPLYKFLLMVCWMPWQAIFMLTVRRDFLSGAVSDTAAGRAADFSEAVAGAEFFRFLRADLSRCSR